MYARVSFPISSFKTFTYINVSELNSALIENIDITSAAAPSNTVIIDNDAVYYTSLLVSVSDSSNNALSYVPISLSVTSVDDGDT